MMDAKSAKGGSRDSDMKSLHDVIKSFPVPWHHCIGNHDLYNFKSEELKNSWFCHDPINNPSLYYSFALCPGIRCVILNSYEVSVNGHDTETLAYKQAFELLERHNPNSVKNSPDGLVGLERRWVAYNGGLGDDQIQWFRSNMKEAKETGERVLIFCHAPIRPQSANDANLVWDYEKALDAMSEYQELIIAVFTGHDHDGGYHFDEAMNIHFLTFRGVIGEFHDQAMLTGGITNE